LPSPSVPFIQVPQGIRRIYIDVGTHFKTEFFTRLSEDSSLFVVGFEPSPTTFAAHQEKFKHERLLLLNAAVGPELRYAPFYVNEDGAHCNPLLRRSAGFISPRNSDGKQAVVHCQKRGVPVQVPVIPLSSIVDQLTHVDYLKIDAQGYDLEILKSVSSSFLKISSIKVECQEVGSDSQLALYENMGQCPEIETYMREKGWELTSKTFAHEAIKEYDMVFTHQNAKLRHSTPLLDRTLGQNTSVDINDIKSCPQSNAQQEYNAKYGTHLPVLATTLRLFQINGVLELGGGVYSTQLFHQSTETVQTIENDHSWYEELKSKFHVSLKKTVIFDETDFSRKEKLLWNDIPTRAKNSLLLYHKTLMAHPEINFLFVDHFVSLRSVSLLSLIRFMDVIVYHDSESLSYGYDGFLLLADLSDFSLIQVSATQPNTSILIRKTFASTSRIAISDFIEELKQQLTEYCDRSVDYLRKVAHTNPENQNYLK